MSKTTLNGCSIVITRPIEQATKLAELISTLGGKPGFFPLLAIAPLHDYSLFEQKLDQLNSYDWAIFISSNAVHNAMPRLLNRLGKVPENLQFAAIGPTTAAELTNYGVNHILAPQSRFDSESLLALPEMLDMKNKKVMIFRGIGGREILADTLRARGAHVDFAECYQRINPQTNVNVLATMWQNKQLDAIVVTSSEAMRHLLSLASNGDTEGATWIRDITLCVNHERIAELPLQLGLKVAIAKTPGDEAMLQCLVNALNNSNNHD